MQLVRNIYWSMTTAELIFFRIYTIYMDIITMLELSVDV